MRLRGPLPECCGLDLLNSGTYKRPGHGYIQIRQRLVGFPLYTHKHLPICSHQFTSTATDPVLHPTPSPSTSMASPQSLQPLGPSNLPLHPPDAATGTPFDLCDVSFPIISSGLAEPNLRQVCHMKPKYHDGVRLHPYCGRGCAAKVTPTPNRIRTTRNLFTSNKIPASNQCEVSSD
jgi:hypothetical protein